MWVGIVRVGEKAPDAKETTRTVPHVRPTTFAMEEFVKTEHLAHQSAALISNVVMPTMVPLVVKVTSVERATKAMHVIIMEATARTAKVTTTAKIFAAGKANLRIHAKQIRTVGSMMIGMVSMPV